MPNQVPASRREQLLGILQHWLRYRPDPIHPGIAKMAKWAAASDRTARVNVRVFENWGVLVPVAFLEGGQGQAVHYLVDSRALFSALCRLGLKPSSFMRSFCDEYAAHYPEVGGSFSNAKQAVRQRRAGLNGAAAQNLSAAPETKNVHSNYPAVYPEGEGGFSTEKHTHREPQDRSERFKAQSIAEPHEPGSARPDYPATYPEVSAPSLRSPSGFLDGARRLRPAQSAARQRSRLSRH
ncbi:MAG: hypothetical protein HZT43_01975 [Exiguobacterium profundum]|nr:MAG: hypothetical protein HZT43_01975 [Exiguobacterium profundum]